MNKPGCFYCADEPEPGHVEMPNGGPTGPCPICNPLGSLDPEIRRKAEIDAAYQQRKLAGGDR